MPQATPVPTKSSGELLTSALWNTYVRDNLNKLLDRGHRVLTVAQFLALTGLEDGDEAYVEVDAANEVQWHVRYKSSSARWRFLGGPSLAANVATAETSASTTYVDLATVGPSITAPLAGVMDAEISAQVGASATGGNELAALKVGAAATADADAGGGYATAATQRNSAGRDLRKTVARNDVLKLQYRENGGGGQTGTWRERGLRIRPVYVTQA